MSNPTQPNLDPVPVSPWRGVAVSAAVVGAVFGVVFFAILGIQFSRWVSLNREDSDRVAVLKQQLQAPGDANERIGEIRQIDLAIRRGTLRWFVLSRRAGLFFLVCLAVFVAGLTAADALQGPQPCRLMNRDRQARQVRQARYATWSVTGMLVLLGLVAGVAALKPIAGPGPAAQAAAPALPSAQEFARNWYRFRGPEGAGISPYTDIPTDWDGPSGKGVLWKTRIPLPGNNSPIVWGDRVFVSGAEQDRCQVYCLDLRTGQVLWTGDVPVIPQEGVQIMEDTGLAACTMAADGARVYAIFATGDLAAFSLDGKRAWHKALGLPDSAYGYASSLETFGGRVIVQFDQGHGEDNRSKVMAFDGATGRLVWERVRPVGGSWTSPIVTRVGQAFQLVTVANPWVIAYDPNTGDEIWKASVAGGDTAPSPICADGLILAIEPYSRVVAVRADGRGDVSETHVAWQSDSGGPDICSPLSDGRHVYLLDTSGSLTVLGLSDGKLVYDQTIEGGFMASPSLVGGEIYLVSQTGTLVRVAAGPSFKELGRCELGEACMASPAFSQGRMILRGSHHVVCIGR